MVHEVGKLNVLVVGQYFPPDIGGAATRVSNIAKGLSMNGCNVTVITAFPHYPHGNIPKRYLWKPIKIEYEGKIRVIRTFMPPIKSEGFFKRLILRATFAITALFSAPFIGNVDVIWASSWAPGYAFSKLKRKKLALNVDDLTLEDLADLEIMDKNSLSFKIGSIAYRIFYVKADILTPISTGYFDIIRKKYCVRSDRLCLIRGGVDLSEFKFTPNKKPTDKFVVLYSGAFSIAYDFKQIIEAAKIIQSIDHEIEFMIQGGGELLSSMYASIKQLEVKNVKIINKIISRAEVAKFLGSADALILPLAPFDKSGKPYRGMSSKLYEYQAVGKPIICCSKGVPATYLEESHSGIVVTQQNPPELVRAVLKLKHNPLLASEFGINGRRYVEKEGSIEVIGQRLKDLLIQKGI
jgi:glycosyltransferase involved in cell wall biosynthesis